MEPAECDRSVDREVNRVPIAIVEPSANDHHRSRDHDHEQERTDRCHDHPGVMALPNHRWDLVQKGDPVHVGVAPDREEDVCQDQPQHRVAVPAMPYGEPVKADKSLEWPESGEQDDLQERQVSSKETGDARDARQQLAF